MNYDPRKAPGHVIGMLAAIAPRPNRPHGRPTPEQWAAQVRAIADRIWAEAFTAGAGYGLSIQPPQPMLVLDQSDGTVNVTYSLVSDDRPGA